jgi:translation initiation factor 2-alpha kinase 3
LKYRPANILIHDYLCVKIADFGLATDKNKNSHNESELKENVGTPLYQSPEQVKGLPYNEKVDIYSLGIILLELCMMFKTQSERRAVLENTRITGQIPERIKMNYPNEYNLIKMMVDGQPLKRPSAKEILNSPELKKLASKYDVEEN